MKIAITGGHFSPAYSILLKLKKGNEILVVGRKHAFENDSSETFEYRVCRDLKIPFQELSTGKLRRRIDLEALKSFSKFPKGVYSAIKILKKNRPDVVVTFGGYIGLPTAIAGKILGIPVILHEQTQKAGLAARLISKFASVVLISFESSRPYFKNKNVILTGNPIRPEFYEKESKSLGITSPSIYITGGSTGSHKINVAVERILPQLLTNYQVFHQTGNSEEFQDFERLKKIEHKNYKVQEFFTPSEVFQLLKKVDLVISRSGINIVTEIIACKVVSLLIPIEIGQQNEQLDNAFFIKKLGIGDCLRQDSLTPETLLEKINDMINKRKFYLENVKNAQSFVEIDATDKIIEQIEYYGKGKSNKKTSEDK